MAHFASHPPAEGGFVSPALSRRAVMFAGIVAVHVVLVYLFASGLAVKTVKLVFEPTEVTFRDDPQKTVDTPPPPPPPKFWEPQKFDFGPIPDPVPGEEDSGTALTQTRTVTEPPVAESAPPRVEPIHLVGKHQLPNTEDYYPPSLIRENVQGATSISVCVDERGKRTGEPTVIESSGSAGLDKAALAIGRDGRYARSARGETFVPNCYAFKIIFKVR